MVICLATLFGCSGMSDQERAAGLVSESRQLVENGQLNSAKILLDSVHNTYPKCVAERRLAKDVQDTIVYLEAQRTMHYSDSVLQSILPQVDPLMKKFRYEKNEAYEDHGKYVHRLLTTGSNTARCYIQSYVLDNRETQLKSYYFGAGVLQQNTIELSVGEEVCRLSGSSHGFDADGYHSILSFEGDQALEILNFISSHQTDRLRINLIGTNKGGKETNYVYYLNDQEKTALQDTYLLGILMNDIRTLEDAIRLANQQIEKYEKKH